jgi:hypothetical protein
MANWSEPATLTTPAGSTDFNPVGGGDGFYLTVDTSGLDQPAIRSNDDDASQTGGGIVHDKFKSRRQPVIVAQYKIVSGTIDDRDAAFDALEAQLDSILTKAAPGTWTMTHRGTPRSLTVWCDVGLTSTGGPQLKQATFGLVAANPDWV